VSEAAALPEPSLRYRWIKANVYSALFGLVMGFAAVALGKALAVSDPDTSAITIAVFAALMGILSALSFAVFARLTGGVLASKLPAFPMPIWMVLHVALGFVLGVLISPAAAIPEEVDPEPLDIEIMAFALIAFVVIGSLVGALLALLQTFVLRKVARGLATWIGFAALAGTTLLIVVVATYLAPETGLMKDVIGQLATFIMSVVAAIIMLPAVRRLQPRETTTAAPDAPPPP
jgi:MFS family permease